MAIVMKMGISGMDSSRYDAILRRLEEIGEGAPDGRLYHICYGDRDNLQVIDVFENHEKFDDFGEKIMPILDEFGVEGKIEIGEVYNIIQG